MFKKLIGTFQKSFSQAKDPATAVSPIPISHEHVSSREISIPEGASVRRANQVEGQGGFFSQAHDFSIHGGTFVYKVRLKDGT